ncbi:hypothetical protein PMIN01_09913 [Paraphaeosphaeria minitans]|uniref:Uncharacterized protein n=1 Tax=Paraphaeosphaeria minitans TaxID=565426 RepID=A0A9P6GAT9_9PLEO|nr:hypothetical protein PMIN01_09913 [Paraphaeosphaeria minitans]
MTPPPHEHIDDFTAHEWCNQLLYERDVGAACNIQKGNCDTVYLEGQSEAGEGEGAVDRDVGVGRRWAWNRLRRGLGRVRAAESWECEDVMDTAFLTTRLI